MKQSALTESAASFTDRLKASAFDLGFHLCGACPALQPEGFHRLLQWIDEGRAGEMHYLDARRDAYQHPQGVMAGVRSLLMLGFPYRTSEPTDPAKTEGRIARYAWGDVDYHDVIHARLKQLKSWVLSERAGATVRGVVDTAPLLEREFAQLAGLGWIGKNTMLINKHQGSYFFLAALLVDIELQYDTPHHSSHCGTCRACLDACPTHAFPEPGTLDATRCISYLTIEHRGPIVRTLREPMQHWVFGCDICQDVCPWNRRGSQSSEVGFEPLPFQNPFQLETLFELDEQQFRARYRKTPLWRAGRRGILRNAAIVLGNARLESSVRPLTRGLHDCETLVRGACAWALGQIGSVGAIEQLTNARDSESEQIVHDEIQAALQHASDSE